MGKSGGECFQMTDEKYAEFLKWAAVEEEAAVRKDRKKIEIVKKKMSDREKGIPIKHKREGVKPPDYHASQSICPDCINCCPVPNKGIGCEWSIAFKPVPGWTAERRDIKCYGKKNNENSESYMVLACPKFIKG